MTPPTSAVEVESLSAEEVLIEAVERFHPKMKLACSFQKEEVVLIHMLTRITPDAQIFTLDTDVLFPETYENWKEMEQRFGVKIEAARGISLTEQAKLYGDELWKTDPAKCCELRKMEPLRNKLEGLDAWIVGVRRDQSPTRANAEKLAWDERNGLWKVAPLADWTDKDVWNYIAEHDLPYNKLHDQGYASIGCTHCTLPGDGREGRWASAEKTECGLHGE